MFDDMTTAQILFIFAVSFILGYLQAYFNDNGDK